MSSITRRGFVKAASGATLSGLALSLGACSTQGTDTAGSDTGSATGELTTIVVGASPTPHAEILHAVEDVLAEAGYALDVVEYSDYVQPNVALYDGSLDANYFQHTPYLDEYNAENGTDIANAGAIHFEPMALYSNTYTSLDDFPEGATIAVPSDATNEARALLLLEAQGILTLAEGSGLNATANEIEDNPYGVELFETEAANVARALEDVDFAIVNGNYALAAGLDTTSSLATEDPNSEAAQTYANIVACRAGEEDSDIIVALVAALQSETSREFIEETYDNTVIPVF